LVSVLVGKFYPEGLIVFRTIQGREFNEPGAKNFAATSIRINRGIEHDNFPGFQL